MIKNFFLTVLFIFLTLIGLVYAAIWQLGIDFVDESKHSFYTNILYQQGYGTPCEKINVVFTIERVPDHVMMVCNDLKLAFKFDHSDPHNIVAERTHPEPLKDPALDAV